MSKPTENNVPRATPGPHRRWFNEGDLKCAWKPCSRPMPAGYYGATKAIYLCCTTCTQRYYAKKRAPLECKHCGKLFKPSCPTRRTRFCSREHYSLWRRRQTDEKKFGRFAGLAGEFIQACIPELRPRGSEGNLRCNLALFFVYLRKRRSRSLAKASPQFISKFFSDLLRTRPRSADKALRDLRLFFDWLIVTGRRSIGNPVLKKLHAQRRKESLPHPYSSADLEQLDSLLEAAGDSRLKLAVTIALEAGLQIEEVCELRLSDVDLREQRLRVRASSRTGLERSALFHTRTKRALEAWLKLRPHVDHDYLLTANRGAPMRKQRLRTYRLKALCGPGKLSQFSFRRLAQTAAARLAPEMDSLGMMANYGWRSERTVEGYRRLPSEELRSIYATAINQLADRPPQSEPKSESMEEYFKGNVTHA